MHNHSWRWLILISLFLTACQSVPVPIQSTSTTNNGLLQERILPSPYLTSTYVRAPIAWTRSTGKGVTIGVVQNHEEDLSLVNLIAPDAQTKLLHVDRHMQVDGVRLLDILQQDHIRLLAIFEPGDFDPQILREAVPALPQAGVAVFLNGDLDDSPEARKLINALEASGAITVGRLKHGERIQGRDLERQQINLFAGYGAENMTFDRGAVLTVAAVGALVLAVRPELDPHALKQQLITTADLMYTGFDPITNRINYSARKLDPQTGEYSPTASAFQFRRVNAAAALDLHLAERWPVNALNAPAAWKTATGRGVKVGVIDSGFYINNPILKDHIVDMFPQKLFSGEQFFPHGTLVAKALLAVAPDVSLVLLHDDDDLDYPARAALEAQAIDHAVQQGVKVITSSNQAWANIPELQAAIDRAIAAGVVFVWSDYTGLNEAVIRPGYFRSSAWEVGTFTFFLDEDRPAESEGGYSFSAPQIAAIAALILQNEPGLTPLQVKQRIIETATVLLPTGVSIADAAAAVENRPSGRKLEARSIPAGAGHVRLTYQTDADQPTVLEIEESHQHWPIASLPRQDILLYRALPALTGPYPATFRLIAYQDRMQVLTIEWSGKEWATGDYPARLTLLPDSEWKPFYLIGLGIREVPALHVEVLSDRVRLSWSSAEGARLTRKDPAENVTQPSSFRLLNVEIETMQMPDLIEPIY